MTRAAIRKVTRLDDEQADLVREIRGTHIRSGKLRSGDWYYSCLEDSLSTAIRAADEIERLRAENAGLSEHHKRITGVVDSQAEDAGIWFVAQTAPEAYLQQELRRLHQTIETDARGREATHNRQNPPASPLRRFERKKMSESGH
ncbi:MAG: hypothetical protein ACE10G_03170 [Gemmatimonadales bacterium]